MDGFVTYFRGLVGRWKVNRKISDGSKFEGRAVFSRKLSDRLLLMESGTLDLGTGVSVSAARSWLWHLASPSVLDIHYPETPPRLYHNLKIETKPHGVWKASASHRCGEDMYDGYYTFDKGRIIVEQTVWGPNKDYTMRTVYLA